MAQAQVIPSQRLYRTTLLYKVGMAVSGLILFGFVVGHMVGNLQVFSGPEAINSYAVMLRKLGGLLWVIRGALVLAVLIHIWTAYKLVMLNAQARPSRYSVHKQQRATFASRTMKWTGPLVLLYLIYHLMHFTIGMNDWFVHLKPYENVVQGFSSVPVALMYIVANLALGVHLWHGAWAMFQSVGLSHPKYDSWRRIFATALSVIVTVGFVSVPVAVMLGIVK